MNQVIYGPMVSTWVLSFRHNGHLRYYSWPSLFSSLHQLDGYTTGVIYNIMYATPVVYISSIEDVSRKCLNATYHIAKIDDGHQYGETERGHQSYDTTHDDTILVVSIYLRYIDLSL